MLLTSKRVEECGFSTAALKELGFVGLTTLKSLKKDRWAYRCLSLQTQVEVDKVIRASMNPKAFKIVSTIGVSLMGLGGVSAAMSVFPPIIQYSVDLSSCMLAGGIITVVLGIFILDHAE